MLSSETHRLIAKIDLIEGELGVAKPKVVVPLPWFPVLARLMPRSSRELLAGPRLAIFQQMSAAPLGIVQRHFGFQPASVVGRVGDYLG